MAARLHLAGAAKIIGRYGQRAEQIGAGDEPSRRDDFAELEWKGIQSARELVVLPPGDVLKCALALARNEAEARRVLLSRVPSIDPRLAGHTGGNLLLSMMERYSGDFLAAVDGLRALLGCTGHVWPVSVE